MVIVNITGQFGNQLFQYALGRCLKSQGRKVLYYMGYYKQHPNYDLALPRLFDLDLPEATTNQVLAYREDRHRIIDRIRRKIFGRHERVFTEIGSKSYVFQPEVFGFKRGLVDGYWQSEKYFLPIREIIRKEFTFPEVSLRNKALAKEMSETMSVSIHVRRGDYLGCFPVMDESYYHPSMSYFSEKYGDVHFYVFSNDINWCLDHLKAKKITYVDWNTGKNSPYDMWLMSQSKHNIIANSSFSWWGAWLNQNDGKEVIAPKTWFYHAETPDIYCKDWLVL
jgi:hypothetical protein